MPRFLPPVLLALAVALSAAAFATASTPTQAEVMAGAARLYQARMDALRAAHKLDADAAFHARVLRIAQPLIAQAARDYPESAAWPWEIHTTSDGDGNAYAMAGGKLLVSSGYVHELLLSDAELAMLLAHEICHAVLRHNLAEYEEALRLAPEWSARPFAELEDAVDNDAGLMRLLAPLGIAQEEQADRAGMTLAWRAGWKGEALARYYYKLSRSSPSPNFEQSGHPAPAHRWRAARELAAALDGTAPVPPPSFP